MVSANLLVTLSGALFLSLPISTLAAPPARRDDAEPAGGLVSNSSGSSNFDAAPTTLLPRRDSDEPDLLGKPPGPYKLPLSESDVKGYEDAFWHELSDGIYGNTKNTDVILCAHDPIIDERQPKQSSNEAFKKGFKYLSNPEMGCRAPAHDLKDGGGWSRVSCSKRSGIYLRNLSLKPLYMPCSTIGSIAEWIWNICEPYRMERDMLWPKGKLESREGYHGQQFEVYIMAPDKREKTESHMLPDGDLGRC